jgi:hypothetical protein
MLEGCAHDKPESKGVPYRHHFAERVRERGCGVGVRGIVQSPELGVNESCYRNFAAYHRCGDDCGRYVVGDCHSLRSECKDGYGIVE